MPKKKKTSTIAIPSELIEKRIYLVRGQKVMLDSDLAELYGVTTGNLNLAVRRNKSRFPKDFMFQLTAEEAKSLLLQTARSKGRGGRRTPPSVFTEQGVAMLSSVLRSEQAVQVNIAIMRAFVRLRELLVIHKDLANKIEAPREKRRGTRRQVPGRFRSYPRAGGRNASTETTYRLQIRRRLISPRTSSFPSLSRTSRASLAWREESG